MTRKKLPILMYGNGVLFIDNVPWKIIKVTPNGWAHVYRRRFIFWKKYKTIRVVEGF